MVMTLTIIINGFISNEEELKVQLIKQFLNSEITMYNSVLGTIIIENTTFEVMFSLRTKHLVHKKCEKINLQKVSMTTDSRIRWDAVSFLCKKKRCLWLQIHFILDDLDILNLQIHKHILQ